MSEPRRTPKLLFCLPTTQLSGGVKVIFEVMGRLLGAGWNVELFSYAGKPRWYALSVPMLETQDISDVDLDAYDFVLVSNAFFVPLVLPHLRKARLVFFAQDYESFHHGPGGRYQDFVSDTPVFSAIYKLPVPIIAISKTIQTLVRERLGKRIHHMPVGLNQAVFVPMPRRVPERPKRVLLIGNYLMPYKGMKDAFAALRILARDLPVQLVLITQETRSRSMFDGLGYPVEIHSFPTEEHVPAIIASCHVLCCASWYEGLGLPALEAFCCGIPVVSTRTQGVSDYGIDGVNLLLAAPSDPEDLAQKLRTILEDPALAKTLTDNAFKTVDGSYDWDHSSRVFQEALAEIDATYPGAGPVDPVAMQKLSAELEAEGSWTPIEVTRRFKEIAEALRSSCQRLADDGTDRASDIAKVTMLRDALKPYLVNPVAQYYGAFRSRYDLCQLILGFQDSPRLASYLRSILSVRDHAKRDAGSYAEIDYRVR